MTKLVVENDNELFNNLPYNSLSNILQNPDISRIHQWHSQVVNHFKDNPSSLKVIERKKSSIRRIYYQTWICITN